MVNVRRVKTAAAEEEKVSQALAEVWNFSLGVQFSWDCPALCGKVLL